MQDFQEKFFYGADSYDRALTFANEIEAQGGATCVIAHPLYSMQTVRYWSAK